MPSATTSATRAAAAKPTAATAITTTPASPLPASSALLDAIENLVTELALLRGTVIAGQQAEASTPTPPAKPAPGTLAILHWWTCIKAALAAATELECYTAAELIGVFGQGDDDRNDAEYVMRDLLPFMTYTLEHADGTLGSVVIRHVIHEAEAWLDEQEDDDSDEA